MELVLVRGELVVPGRLLLFVAALLLVAACDCVAVLREVLVGVCLEDRIKNDAPLPD